MSNKDNKDNIEEKIKIELMDLLSDEAIKVVIDPTFDIPVYVSQKNKKENYKKVLVLSGGGVLGVAYIGALQAFQDLNYLDKFEEFATTSVGTLIIGMYLMGYSPKELKEFTTSFDYGKIKNINILNIVNNFGVDDCSKLEYVIDRMITAKGLDEDITLRDLYLKTNKKFIITSTCINTMTVEYISHENSPNMSLAKAIRMSISIPLFYTPCKYNNKLYVDGGLMDNYPMSLYKDRSDEVVGIFLYNDNADTIDKIHNLEAYSYRIFQCFQKSYTDRNLIAYEKNTIKISIDSIGSVQYNLTKKQKSYMYDRGYQEVINYFKSITE